MSADQFGKTYATLCELSATKGVEHGRAMVIRHLTGTAGSFDLYFVKNGEKLTDTAVQTPGVKLKMNEVFAKAADDLRVAEFEEGKNSLKLTCSVQLPADLKTFAPSHEHALNQALVYEAESYLEFERLNGGGPHENVCHLYGVQIVGPRLVQGLVIKHHVKTLATLTAEEKSELARNSASIMASVRAGLEALHKVNLAVNFLTPGSVAIDEKKKVFLLGPFAKFDTDLTPAQHKPATWKEAWGNPKKSSKQNDDDALKKLEEWFEGRLSYTD